MMFASDRALFTNCVVPNESAAERFSPILKSTACGEAMNLRSIAMAEREREPGKWTVKVKWTAEILSRVV